MSAAATHSAAWPDATPRLSVLTPFYRDDPRPLVQALEREAAGMDGAVELVLLDDAGGDPELSNAVDAAVRVLAIPASLIRLSDNEGRAKGRNRLASAARARHLLFVDSDMLPDRPDFLRAWLALAAHTDAPAAFGGFSLDQATPGPEHALHHAMQLRAECLCAAERSRQPAKHVFTSNLLVRRDVLEACAFDEGFSGWGWEDVEWGARVAERWGVLHIDNPATHLGLDTDAALAAKYAQSGPNFARVLARHPALVQGFPSYRAARWLRRLPARSVLRSGLKALALSAAPLPARVAAMKLFRAAVYAEVVGVSVTVLIPTLRRPESLARTLRSVFVQEGLAEIAVEIVVVDNAPEASARPMVDALRAESPTPLVYIHAPRPGVATARNAGLAVATGEHVAFIDDDEGAHPGWLRALLTAHIAFDADITFGPVQGRALEAKPSERAYLDRFFSRLKPGPSALLADTAGCGCGNSIMRRATALPGPVPFDVAADALGGEDDRLFAKLTARGARFAWAADAWVDEFAPANRATPRYALTRALIRGQGPPRICLRRSPPDRLGAARWMAIGGGQAIAFGAAALALRLAGRDGWLDLMDKAAQGAGKVLWPLQLELYGAAA